MTIEISYWTASLINPNIAGAEIAGTAESLSITGTSARSGVTPDNAVYILIEPTEACRFSYASATSTAAATTPYRGSGKDIWLDAKPGFKVAGKTP